MFKKGTKAYSIFNNKCPKCHEGAYYESSNPYKFSKLGDMPDSCSVCGQSYRMETGFYFGAAYVSYGIGVAIFVAIWVATTVLFPDISIHIQVISIVVVLVVLFPVNFWLSRIIWINLFVKYDQSKHLEHTH